LGNYVATGKAIDFTSYYTGRQVSSIQFDAPVASKSTSVIWRLRGNRADPVHMPMPANGYSELLAPLSLNPGNSLPDSYQSFTREINVKEQLILDYLANMRVMIEAQQKVMMSYFAEINGGVINTERLNQLIEPASFTLPSLEAKAAVSEPVTAPQTTSAEQVVNKFDATQSSTVEVENLKAKTLEIICHKTGYPVEMLDEQMDLEADLSIDSIKRTEIINSLASAFPQLFQGGKASSQQISALKTIQELVDFLCRQNGIAAISNTAPEQPKAAVNVAVESPVTKEILLSIISERTGYPVEMLDMDMDLEADLSIDSIKRAEIVNALKSRLALPENEATKSSLTRLASCKKLNEIEVLLSQLGSDQGTPVKKPVAATSLPHEEVRRYQFELVQTHSALLTPSSRLDKVAIGIFEDGSDEAITLHGQLTQLGADVSMVSVGQSNKELDALIYLDLATSKNKLSQEGLFSLAKSLNFERLKWFLGVTDIHNRVASLVQPEAILKELNGFYGFINSLNKEWPAVCREINLDMDAQQNIAPTIVAEFFHDKKEETVVH
jgi:acyl carrier protein